MNSAFKAASWMKDRPFRGSILASIFLIASGCNSASKQACLALPELEVEVAQKVAELTPYAQVAKKSPSKSGRSIASASTLMAPTDDNRESWMGWAEDRLKEAQNLRDGLESEARSKDWREPLNSASLSLVNFHGYLSQKKYDRALQTLQAFQGQVIGVRGQLCSPRGEPAAK